MKNTAYGKRWMECFSVVQKHPVLLAINAVSLILMCICFLRGGNTWEVTMSGFWSTWAVYLLMLDGILLTGLFPGFFAELIAIAALGSRLVIPSLSLLLENRDYAVMGTLFLQFFTLLLSGTLAGAYSLRAACHWTRVLILWIDPYRENEALDLDPLPPPNIKALSQELQNWFLQAVVPLSALAAWASVYKAGQ